MATTAKKTAAKPMHKPTPQAAKPVQTTKPPAQGAVTGRTTTPATAKPNVTEHPKPQVPAVIKPGGAVVEMTDAVPAHMQQYAGQGMENTRREDLDTPRLKLIQGLSPELQVYDSLKAGHFLHTTQEIIFDKPFRAVVLFKQFRYILWDPMESGGGILARADDGVHWAPADTEFDVTLDKKDGGHKVKWTTAQTVAQSGLANWGTMNPGDNDSPPAATLMYEYILAFPDNPDVQPAALTLQRASIKQGKRWNTKIATLQRFPMFGCVFEISSFQDTNRNGQDFFNVNAVGAGLIGDPGLLEQYKNLYDTFKSTGVRIKDEGSIQREADSQGGAEDNAPEGAPKI